MMFGLIEQLNILERWKKHDSTLSLQAPIGVDDSGRIISLDIHEKFHGPHGLIAGSTGSGKSEFIITYILSLAINYHPDDVNFILIDYKGGGLAGAFQKRGVKLPHLVGTITNIDTVGLQRSLASIQSELRRRQVIFNEARNITDEGTIDIYKYQKLYHEGKVSKAVPHLLIICDEFAELKQQQEDFMEELMSVSRIGRSLGVHLILATQKPAGIVNDQIRSNSKFAVCLKVQDREDSNDVIKRPDAASLKNAGQFYLQVGNDEYFVLGQSAWSGAPYFPSDINKKKIDNSIQFISNIGAVIKKVDDSTQKIINSDGEQLTNIVRYMYELAERENIHEQNLWLDSIPETIFVKELRKKYNVKIQENKINIIAGEYDDPENQHQGVVNLDFSKEGNLIVYGNADSGKETLLSTICYDAITTYSSEELWLYLLDFGSEALKIFSKAPQVGDIIFMNETEKLNRFFDMIQKEIKDRKAILSDYNGDYQLYLKTSGQTMPMIMIIINNYEAFSENYEDEYEDTISIITREGIKYGIEFIITTTTYGSLRYRLTQNFKQKIALQLNNEDDYTSIFDSVGKKRPSHIFGRGLVSLNGGDIYEFQTAKICEPENWNTHIKEKIEEIEQRNEIEATHIPVMPSKVTFDSVKESLTDISSVPIGITKSELKTYNYDFKNNFINIITSKSIEDATIYSFNIIEEMANLNNVKITILNAERSRQSKKNNLRETYMQLENEIKEEELEEQDSIHHICAIIGIDNLLNKLEEFGEDSNDDDNLDGTEGFGELESGEEKLEKLLKKAEKLEKYSFIIVENVTKLKSHEYDEWYKNYVIEDSGIWVGKGIDDQYLMNINTESKDIENNCGRSIGYVVKQGTPILIKLLEMKEKGDNDE